MNFTSRQSHDIRLRPATPADIPALYPLHRAAYEEVCVKTWGPWDDAWQQGHFRDTFDCAIREVIHAGGRDVGYMDVLRHGDHVWLAEIVIGPEFQCRGIGSYLVRRLIAEAREKSLPLKLKVLKVNRAQNLYQRMGFRVTGHTDTHVLMQIDSVVSQIRPATPADVPTILALIRELAEYEKLAHACVATEELLRTNLFGPDRAAEALVALQQEAIVGYAIFFKTFSTFLARPGLYLEDIYVQPAHRGKGLGKAMLRHIARLAVERNYGRVEWCVLNWNMPSINFYKSLGAFPMNEWTTYRLTDEALHAFATG